MSSHREKLFKTKMLIDGGIINAPVSFSLTKVEKLIKVCNGCGAAGSWFDYVPDNIIGSYIGHACFIHDWEYHVGKTKADKKLADKRFKRNLLKIIKLKSTNIMIIGLKYFISCMYYFGVKKFGKKAYWKGKQQKG